MTLSALQKFLLAPAIASLSVFSLMSFPLATLGDKQIAIKFQEEPIFSGKLRDVAIPYVVFATVLSIGSGISALAFCGWRNSSSKSAKIQQELSNLEQHLQQKETLLKEWQISEPRLQISGLNAFLDDEVPFDQALISKNSAITASQPVEAQTQTPVDAQPVNPLPKVATQKNTTTTMRDIAATSAFASTQTFLGYAQENPNSMKEITAGEVNQIAIIPLQYEELQKQIKEMMLQMQAMQENLQLTSQATNAEVKSPAKFQIYYNTVL
ncbi:MAG: hypothetical protein V7K32_05645 [Nostoc sp.]|uniref:hypothetical protein n=1 Tax=Nostoc sp. TaxID=1180 RepID=UPI002FF795F0